MAPGSLRIAARRSRQTGCRGWSPAFPPSCTHLSVRSRGTRRCLRLGILERADILGAGVSKRGPVPIRMGLIGRCRHLDMLCLGRSTVLAKTPLLLSPPPARAIPHVDFVGDDHIDRGFRTCFGRARTPLSGHPCKPLNRMDFLIQFWLLLRARSGIPIA